MTLLSVKLQYFFEIIKGLIWEHHSAANCILITSLEKWSKAKKESISNKWGRQLLVVKPFKFYCDIQTKGGVKCINKQCTAKIDVNYNEIVIFKEDGLHNHTEGRNVCNTTNFKIYQ